MTMYLLCRWLWIAALAGMFSPKLGFLIIMIVTAFGMLASANDDDEPKPPGPKPPGDTIPV